MIIITSVNQRRQLEFFDTIEYSRKFWGIARKNNRINSKCIFYVSFSNGLWQTIIMSMWVALQLVTQSEIYAIILSGTWYLPWLGRKLFLDLPFRQLNDEFYLKICCNTTIVRVLLHSSLCIFGIIKAHGFGQTH